jgi:hypothetical protein
MWMLEEMQRRECSQILLLPGAWCLGGGLWKACQLGACSSHVHSAPHGRIFEVTALYLVGVLVRTRETSLGWILVALNFHVASVRVLITSISFSI